MNKNRLIAFLLIVIAFLLGYIVNPILNPDNSSNNVITSYYGDNTNNSNTGIAYMLETGENTGVYEQSNNTNWPTDAFYNSEKSACENGSTLTYNDNTHQLLINSTKTDKCYIYFKNKGTYFYENVQYYNNNSLPSSPDDYGTSYYFTCGKNNNWVKFSNIYWRIIRINGDNSVRMIYSGTTAPTESQAMVMTGNGTQIGNSVFNSNYSDNMYVGYMYTSGELHGYNTSSTIKTYIDNWYSSNLQSNSSVISDAIYCNDRSLSSGSGI